MSQVSSVDQPKIVKAIPEPLHNLKRFLLWKEFPGTKPGKTIKTPFYASGHVRKGLLDTEADLAKLVTLEEALDAYMLGGYSGIGFAVTGENIGAFDLDHCLTDEGHLVKDHPGHDLILEAKRKGCYIEISPSGHGLRIVGPCPNIEAYSRGGVEYWGAKRYVTLTGEVWANPGGWVALNELRDSLTPPREEKPEVDEDEDELGIITPRTIAELESALESMSSDERQLWVDMGHALKTLGKKGYGLWIEWSKKSKKFNPADADRVWDSLRPNHTNYKAVFAEAQKNWDWQNPRKRIELVHDEEPDEPEPPAPELGQIELGDQRLYATEFILDGFLPAQVSVIAGAWGAGKSTNLIPLLASAAHLAPERWGFWPDLRRHVLWITEAPEQARDTLYSLAKAEDAASWDEFKEWFHLFPARRRSAKVMAKIIKRLIDNYCWTTDTGFRVKPVVVLDTTTANLDLENESDNSMVGAAMSTLKQQLPGIPLILIGHTPKAVQKADVGDATFRGAGAWEAEAAATYFLIYDQETEMRFLAIRKCRFTPTYREIDFDYEAGSEIVDTPWGEPQSKSYLHGIPNKSDGAARRAAQAEAREERREEAKEVFRTARQEKILEFVRSAAERGVPPTRIAVREAVGGKNELVREATERLLEAGTLTSHIVDPERLGIKSGRVPEILLPAEVELNAFLERIK